MSHFTDEIVELQRGEGSCPRHHNWCMGIVIHRCWDPSVYGILFLCQPPPTQAVSESARHPSIGNFFFFFNFLVAPSGMQDLNSLHWKLGVLTTGSAGKSLGNC